MLENLQGTIDTYSEEYRNQCEARELLTWPLVIRRKQLCLIAEKRGHEAYLKLTDEMKKQWLQAKEMK